MGGRGSSSPGSRGGQPDEPKSKDKGKGKKGQEQPAVEQNQEQERTGQGSESEPGQEQSPPPGQQPPDEAGEGTASSSDNDNDKPPRPDRPVFIYTYEGPGQGTSANPSSLNVGEESLPFGVQPVELEEGGGSNGDGSNNNEGAKVGASDDDSLAQNQWEQQGEPRVSVRSELPPPPSVSIRESGGRGKVWKKRLGEAWATGEGQPGQQLDIEEDGFRVNQVVEGVEITLRVVEFYPGFGWDKLNYRMSEGLGLTIIESRGLQRLLVEGQPQQEGGTASTTPSESESKEAVATALKRLWTRWERGKAKGRFKNVASFTRYVASNGYRVGLDEGTPLVQAIEGYNALSPREQAVAVLDTTEPRLRSELPERLRERLEELLDRPGLLARSPMLGQARTPLVSRVNAMLAYEVADYREFEDVMRVVEQPASRGSIGEMVFRRFFAEERTRREEMRKPYFERVWYDDENASQPDMVRPLSARTLDVKVGYTASQINDKQLEKYVRLVRASFNAGNEPLRQKLRDLGIAGRLKVHDLVFMSDGTSSTSAKNAATNALGIVESNFLNTQVAVYFVGYGDLNASASSSSDDDAKAGVYRLKRSDEVNIEAIFVGERLPD